MAQEAFGSADHTRTPNADDWAEAYHRLGLIQGDSYLLELAVALRSDRLRGYMLLQEWDLPQPEKIPLMPLGEFLAGPEQWLDCLPTEQAWGYVVPTPGAQVRGVKKYAFSAPKEQLAAMIRQRTLNTQQRDYYFWAYAYYPNTFSAIVSVNPHGFQLWAGPGDAKGLTSGRTQATMVVWRDPLSGQIEQRAAPGNDIHAERAWQALDALNRTNQAYHKFTSDRRMALECSWIRKAENAELEVVYHDMMIDDRAQPYDYLSEHMHGPVLASRDVAHEPSHTYPSLAPDADYWQRWTPGAIPDQPPSVIAIDGLQQAAIWLSHSSE